MSPSPRLRPVPDNPGRVVLYARVSALMGREGDNFHSPDLQVSAMRRLTAGMREVAVVQDIDQTGRNFNRAGINKIRRMAEGRQIDAVAVYDVSRLGRNVRESLTFLAELAGMGVTVISACEHIDTSDPAGRLMLTNMLAIAEYRSDEIGRSWAATIARRAELGMHHGNPIGYTRDGGRLVPDPILGPAITKAWRDYAAGVPISQICRDVAGARGSAVQASNLKTMFKRPAYLGHAVSYGVVVKPDAHQPLTDQATWDRVQLRLARDRVTPSRNLEVTWSLVGISFCPCGARLQRNPARRRGQVEQRLKCGKGPGRGIQGGCAGIGMPLLEQVEAEVLKQAVDYAELLVLDIGVRADQVLRRNTALADERALRRRLTHVQEGLVRLAKALAMGDLQQEEFRSVSVDLRAEREALQAKLSDLGDVESRQSPENFASSVTALVARWPEMEPQHRNRALRVLIERVEVRRAAYWREPESDRVTVTWR
jgi:site-specific DNA recombinase